MRNVDNRPCCDSGFFSEVDVSGHDDCLQLISETATSHVYLGSVNGIRRIFKVVAPQHTGSQLYADMLHKEFDILSTLSHPGIVTALGLVNISTGPQALMMEWVDGVTLQDFLTGNPDDDTRQSLALQLLDAVEYLHAKGIVHRDIKPTNILVAHDGNRLKLIDFGLADNSAYTRLKMVAGTPGYMSAHQSGTSSPTTGDDLHGVAVVLEELLTDRRSLRIARRCRKGHYATAVDLRSALCSAWERPARLRRFLRQGIILMASCAAVAMACIHFFTEQMNRQHDMLTADIDAQRLITARVSHDADSVHRQDSMALTALRNEQLEAQRLAEQHSLMTEKISLQGEQAIDRIWRGVTDNDTHYRANVQSNDFIKDYLKRQKDKLTDAELSALESQLTAHWREHHDSWKSLLDNN